MVILLAVYAFHTLHRLRNNPDVRGHIRDALYLTYFALIAIVFALVRVIYSVVYAFNRSPSLSPLTATFAVRFLLIFLVQLLAALCLVVGGVISRNICMKSECLL